MTDQCMFMSTGIEWGMPDNLKLALGWVMTGPEIDEGTEAFPI